MSSICESSICESPICCEEMNLEENWAWVDKRLEELYYNYALTEENYEDYIDAGLLEERWSWVDDELERRDDELERRFNEEFIHRPAPLSWVLYKNRPKQYCLEDLEEIKYIPNRIECQSPLPISFYPIDYDFADDVSSNSNYLEFSQCSPISLSSSRCSESSNMIYDIDYDYNYDYECDLY